MEQIVLHHYISQLLGLLVDASTHVLSPIADNIDRNSYLKHFIFVLIQLVIVPALPETTLHNF